MSHKKKSNFALFLIVLFALGCCDAARDTVTITTSTGDVAKVTVEVADTPQKRAMGLMFRESLPEDTGMLFLFSEETQGSFWMKNTPISLDILFIRDAEIVWIFENTTPFDESLLTPEEPYAMALEVEGGYSERHGIHVGDSLTFTPAH